MKDYFNKPIFVLGLPRSGTSMISGSLAICGAWTGSTVPGGLGNPKGFFEHTVIREQVIKKLLADLGCDPLGVRSLPPINLQMRAPNLADIIRGILERDGYSHDQPWLLKDAKLTLLWPIFKKAFSSARWLIVQRDEEGFINSCLRTHFMKVHSQDRGFWKKVAEGYQARIDTLKNSGAEILEISSQEVVSGNFENLRKLVCRLGLTYREDELGDFISPSYWREK
jgi:hypothetical protein